MQWLRSHSRIRTWLLLSVALLFILAVTSHAAMQSLRHWMVLGTLMLLLAALGVGLMALAPPSD